MFQRLKHWLTPATSANAALRIELSRLLGASLWASILLSLVAILFAFVLRLPSWERLIRDAVIVLLISFALWGLLKRGYERLVTYGVVVSLTAFAVFSAFTGVGVRGTAYGLLLLIIMLAALFIHRHAAYLMAVVSGLIGLGLMAAHQAGWMPNVDRPLAEIASWFIQVIYFFIAAIILDIALRQIDRAFTQARHELEERKRAEEKILALNAELEQRVIERTSQLAAREERYRTITEISSDYVFSTEVNAQGTLAHTWVAGAFEAIMGYTFEEYNALGGWSAVLHPDDVAQDARDMEKLHQNQPMHSEIRVITKSGEVRWISVYGYPVWHSTENRLVGINGAVQDITLRKHIEEALREAELRYRSLVEQTSVVIYRDSPEVDSTTLYISPQIETMLGYIPGEWVDGTLRWQTIIHPDDLPRAKALLQNQLQTGETVTDTYRLRARDGHWVWVRDEAVVINGPDGRPGYIQGVLIDITEQKMAENRLAALYQLSQEIVASLDIEQICQSAYRAVAQLMPTQAFFIALHDEEREEIEDIFLFDHGERWPNRRTPLARRGMSASVIKSKTPLYIEDEAASVSAAMGTVTFGTSDLPRSLIIAPLQISGKVLGVISSQHYAPRMYTSSHIEMLVNLGNQVAIALEHARLVQSLRLQAIALDAAANAIVITDREGVIQWVNPAFTKSTGYPAEEVIGRSTRLLKSDHHPKAFYQELWQTVLAGDPWHGEIINRRKDGSFYTEEQLITPVRNEHGEIFRFVAIKQDVTARKLAEARLAASEERYRNFIAQSSEGIWRVEHEKPISIDLPEDEQIQQIFQYAYIAECNDAMARMYGYTRAEDVNGKYLRALLPASEPYNLEYVRQFIRMNYRLSETESHEIDRQGQARYFLNSIVGVVENGILVRSWGMQRDVTDRQEAEVRAQRRRKLLEKVIELGKSVTQETDLQACLKQIHRGVQKGLGFDRVGIFLYEEATDMIHGAFGTGLTGEMEDTSWYTQKAADSDAWRKALSSPSGVNLTEDYTHVHHIAADNEMFGVNQHISLSAWAGEKPVALIAADNLITQKPITPEQLEGLQLFAGYAGLAIVNSRWNAELGARVTERTAELEAANQELQGFTYTIAHDLRAPARAMIGFSGLLAEHLTEQFDLDTTSENHLRRVQNAAKRMGQMIDELLEYTRLGRVRLYKQTVDIHAMVTQILDHQQTALMGRDIRITLHPLPPCQGDARWLEIAWQHLIDNALKFTQTRAVTLLEIGAGGMRGETPYYFIRDNGIGFDMKYLDKIFGVFQRLHIEDEFEGTGMGLALTSRIIEQHGGRIWAEAAVDQGATFFFTLHETDL